VGGWLTPRPGRFTPGKEIWYPLYRRLGRPQSRSGRTRKNSPPIGFRSPDRPARSESLYRLHYPAPQYNVLAQFNSFTFIVICKICNNSNSLSTTVLQQQCTHWSPLVYYIILFKAGLVTAVTTRFAI
jgi:hypothetical protein